MTLVIPYWSTVPVHLTLKEPIAAEYPQDPHLAYCGFAKAKELTSSSNDRRFASTFFFE